jgi:hypothetical protein
VVTHQVVNQPWINYRRSVVNDMGSVRRLNGQNGGVCLDIWDDMILWRRLGVDEA